MSPKMERNWKEKRGAEMSRKPRKKVLAEWGRRKGEVVSPVSPERKAGRMGSPWKRSPDAWRHLHHQKTHPPTLLFKPDMHTFAPNMHLSLDLEEWALFLSGRTSG